MKKWWFIYILASKKHGILYIGVTSDLIRRIYEHKNGITKWFTSCYHAKKLVYYEAFDTIEDAISREKQLKAWSRKKKVLLIEKIIPNGVTSMSKLRRKIATSLVFARFRALIIPNSSLFHVSRKHLIHFLGICRYSYGGCQAYRRARSIDP